MASWLQRPRVRTQPCFIACSQVCQAHCWPLGLHCKSAAGVHACGAAAARPIGTPNQTGPEATATTVFHCCLCRLHRLQRGGGRVHGAPFCARHPLHPHLPSLPQLPVGSVLPSDSSAKLFEEAGNATLFLAAKLHLSNPTPQSAHQPASSPWQPCHPARLC